MTTIAACLELGMMAADSRVTMYLQSGEQLHAYSEGKLIRNRGWIIGCAGNQEDIDAFLLWLPDMRKRRKKVQEDFTALLLSRKRLLVVDDNSVPREVPTGYMAVGSGGGYAMASLNTMLRTGIPLDPRIAVEVACEHDTQSGPPVEFMCWGDKYKAI